ncbi:MAG: hypothetical protein M4D80_26390 [Myxococcota bacterium]|nr:hypothetical protein [Deltaproteobacteria bacterium]MDQ3338710.1 hypothetical protein [Myxococcota bacterium]
MAFLVLAAVVAVRFGCKDSPPEAPAQPIVDAAVADAPIDAAAVVPDAAPTPKKRAPKRTPTRKPIPPRPEPKPTPFAPTPFVPTPVVPTPVVPTPVTPPVKRCTQPPNPAGCPAKEPNINRPCDVDGVQCVYGTSCCPPLYVCNNGAFEAWFTSCP